jgi:hypothetical protein
MVDINHPPAGGFTNGGWFWDPSVGQARQYWNGSFGPPNTINNPNQSGYGQPVGNTNNAPPTTTPTSPLQAVNQSIESSFQKLNDEVKKRFGEYKSGKPFRVDEILAEKTKTAAEQIDPYYNQILGDYLLGVTRKLNRGIDDTKDLLSELNSSTQSYTREAQNSLQSAMDNAEQGFADSGLTGSGTALRAEGQLKQNYGANTEDYLRKTGAQEKQLGLGLSRNIQDINADKKNFVTNLEQNRFTDTSNRAGALTKEAGQQYIQGFSAALPPELQSASGFDMLKSLGIYS